MEHVLLDRWERMVRQDSHGRDLVHYVVELDLGNAYGPWHTRRLIPATTDPRVLKEGATWYRLTPLPLQEAGPRKAYCFRDLIEHHYKLVKDDLSWGDFQTRDAKAIVRHWHLVMRAFTFSVVTESSAGWVRDAESDKAAGGKTRGTDRVSRDRAPCTRVAPCVGADRPLLADVVACASTTGTAGASGTRRTLTIS